jgi:capsular exopolysaccharide synthesis family protein
MVEQRPGHENAAPGGGAIIPAPPAAPGLAPQPGAAPASGKPSLLGLFLAFRRRWALVVTVGAVLAAAAAAAAWFNSPSTHAGRTLLEVSSVTPRFFVDVSTGGGGFDGYQRAQVAMVRSRLVLTSALRDPKVAELPVVRQQANPLTWLEAQVHADFSIAPEIMAITMSGDDPKAVELILNAVRDAYLKEVVGRERKIRNEQLDELRKVFTEYDTLLREKRRALRTMSDDLGARDAKILVLKQELNLKALSEIQTELIQLQSRLRMARLEAAFQQQKEKAAHQPPSEGALEELVSLHPDLKLIRDDLGKIEKSILDYEATARHPERDGPYQVLLAARDATKQKLTDRKAKLMPELREQLREQRQRETRLSSEQNQEKIAQYEKLEQMLTGMIEDYAARTKDIGKKANDVEWIKDEIEQVDDVAKKVANKIQFCQIEQRAPDRVRLLEEAVVQPPSASKARNASLAAAAVFGLVAFGLTFWEYRTGKVSRAGEVADRLQLRVVGSLPLLPERIRRGQYRAGNTQDIYWRNLLTESVDSTRTLMVHTAERESLRVIMVTSALGGEGKTMLASHLVASLARAGRKAVLIDCDLRRPAVHRVFNLPAGPGLSELLRGEAEQPDVIYPGPIAGLSLIPAGRPDAAAVQALAHGGVRLLFQKLREQYDFVIVDSAPVLPVTDSQLVGQCADGVLLAVMMDVSRLTAIAAAHDRLVNLNIRILGTVIHGEAEVARYAAASRYLIPEAPERTAAASA